MVNGWYVDPNTETVPDMVCVYGAGVVVPPHAGVSATTIATSNRLARRAFI
jgi:hypothetical protein